MAIMRGRSATPIRAHSGSSCATRMPAILILYFREWTEARITVGYATCRFALSAVSARARTRRLRHRLVVDARGRRSRDIVEQALGALVRMTHRGAPPETASIDGSGILTQIPGGSFATICRRRSRPAPGRGRSARSSCRGTASRR
jgi:hypothetical protein